MTTEIAMLDCDGYRSLLAAVEEDESKGSMHDYRGKLQWAIDRAKHYASKTGLTAEEILDSWEAKRDYWYMNYYQEARQPEIKGDAVRIFDTVEELRNYIGSDGFRCPMCKGVSTSPTECNSGVELDLIDGKHGPCNWKVYGLFGHLGRGVFVFVKEKVAGQNIFKPVAWE